jgi:dipeptidyl-peptidase-4
MKKILAFSAIILLVSTGFAQNTAKKLTIEDAILKSRTTLAPGRLTSMVFAANAGTVSYIDEKDGGTLTLINAKGEKIPVMTLKELNESAKKAGRNEWKTFPVVEWVNAQTFRIYDQSWWNMDLKSKTLANTEDTDLTTGLENADLSPDKVTVAYTRDNNLYIKINGAEKAVSTDGNEGLTYGASNVHRNEFGIGKGTFFSPQGKYLAKENTWRFTAWTRAWSPITPLSTGAKNRH